MTNCRTRQSSPQTLNQLHLSSTNAASINTAVFGEAGLLTLFVELYLALCKEALELQPGEVIGALEPFFEIVDRGDFEGNRLAATYYKSALQASNDRVNRVRRGAIVGGLIRGVALPELEQTLTQAEML